MIISVSLFPRCELCHFNSLGTLFQCPSSALLSDSGEIEFQVYETVDHTERQAAQAGTGAIMQGVTVSSTSFFLQLIQLFLSLMQTNVLNDALLLPSSPNRFGTERWPQNVVGSEYRGLLPFGSGCWLCTKLWTHISGLYRPPPPFPPIHIVTFHFSNWCVEHFSPFKS